MKNLNKYSNEKLKEKINKHENKIDQYAMLFWFASMIGVALLFGMFFGLICQIAWFAKTCLIVAGLQVVNVCMFFGLAMKRFDKKLKLKQELEKREEYTEHYESLEKTDYIEKLKRNQSVKSHDKSNKKETNKDDDLDNTL